MTTELQIHEAFIKEVKRRLFEEGVMRIKKCIDLLSEEQIWYRPNEHSNSVGNLILHLCGNVRQWILTGLGKEEDIRQRQKEFDEKGPLATQKMLDDLDALMLQVDKVLDRLSPEDLLAIHDVQGFEENGLAILVHVVEHFSYHVGQITYIVKALKDTDTGYYKGIALE